MTAATIDLRETSAAYMARSQGVLLRGLDIGASASNGVAKLRELILILAMQGRLVAQSAADESVDVLLEQTKLAKSGASNSGRRKAASPQIPVDSEEQSFSIPASWRWVRVGDVCSYIQRGKGPDYAEASAFPVVSQKCVRWSGLDLSRARFITPASLRAYDEERFLRVGDVLWNSTGTGTIGRATVVSRQTEFPKVVADSHVTVVRPVGIDPDFLWRWIQSPYVQAEIEDSASGSTNQIELALATIVAHPVPLPPLAEQHRIVARVEELIKLCDALEQCGRLADEQHARLTSTLFDALASSESAHALAGNWQRVAEHFDLLLDRPEAIEALERTILSLSIRGRLVPQELTELSAVPSAQLQVGATANSIDESELPFDIPTGWRWIRLGWAAELINGDRGTNYPNRAEYVACGLPFINTGHIEPDGTLSQESMNYLTRKKFDSLRSGKTRPGDLVYCLRGATLGKTAIVEYTEGAIASSLAIIRLNEAVDRKYAYYFLIGPLGRDLIKRFDNGSAQPNLAANSVKRYVMPMPPIAEQRRIVARVEELRVLCASLRQRLALSREAQSRLADALVAEVA